MCRTGDVRQVARLVCQGLSGEPGESHGFHPVRGGAVFFRAGYGAVELFCNQSHQILIVNAAAADQDFAWRKSGQCKPLADAGCGEVGKGGLNVLGRDWRE